MQPHYYEDYNPWFNLRQDDPLASMRAQDIVAHNLRKIRVKRGLSQEALAAEAEVDRSYVGRLERGNENPTIGMLEKLAAVLSVRIQDFLVKPRVGAARPAPLKGGRKPK